MQQDADVPPRADGEYYCNPSIREIEISLSGVVAALRVAVQRTNQGRASAYKDCREQPVRGAAAVFCHRPSGAPTPSNATRTSQMPSRLARGFVEMAASALPSSC